MVTYDREVSHDILSRLQHTTDIVAMLHEAHALTPGHVSEEVPSEIRDPVSDIACLVPVVTLHETTFKLGTEDMKIFIHQRFKLQSTLKVV